MRAPTDTAALVGTGQPGTIYLLHFDAPLAHARHYLGWAKTLNARLAKHGTADGSALMRAVAAAGIGWQLARTWPGADRHLERRLKNQRQPRRHCPICKAARPVVAWLCAWGTPKPRRLRRCPGDPVVEQDQRRTRP